MRVCLAVCITIQFCYITAQYEYNEEQDTSCESNADCAHNAVCHRLSKMCICNNGQSNYPACVKNLPNYNSCRNQCQDNEYCDLDGTCQCKWGGMSQTNCCQYECNGLQSCSYGQCECKFGEYLEGPLRGRCRSCKRFCERENGYCHHRSRKCKCKQGFKGKFPNCRREESSFEHVECSPNQEVVNGKCEFKKEECPNECGPGGSCFKTDGRIICITCGPGYEPYKMQCRKIPVWADWGPWSHCSVTCGHGNSRRERECRQPDRKCKGGPDEETRGCTLGACPPPPPPRSCDGPVTGPDQNFKFCVLGNCNCIDIKFGPGWRLKHLDIFKV